MIDLDLYMMREGLTNNIIPSMRNLTEQKLPGELDPDLDYQRFYKAYHAAKNNAKHYPDVETETTVRDLPVEKVKMIGHWHRAIVQRVGGPVGIWFVDIELSPSSKLRAMSVMVDSSNKTISASCQASMYKKQ